MAKLTGDERVLIHGAGFGNTASLNEIMELAPQKMAAASAPMPIGKAHKFKGGTIAELRDELNDWMKSLKKSGLVE